LRLDRTIPLIPAKAGIQINIETSIIFVLGPRFRGDERSMMRFHLNATRSKV
jgi:hypothetical protein